jgi:hypothetical protein
VHRSLFQLCFACMGLGAGFVVQDLDISLSRCSVGKGMDVPQIFFLVWFLIIVALLAVQLR